MSQRCVALSLAIVLGLAICHAQSALAASGGPDAFGYFWNDSAETNGPVYTWEAQSGATQMFLGDDDAQQVTLPFSFEFYGTGYTSLWVGSNGWVSFTDYYTWFHNGIPNPSIPNTQIAVQASDLNPAAGGTVWHQTMGTAPNRVWLLCFDTVPYYAQMVDNSWQLKLFEGSNQIEIHFRSTSSMRLSTTGIENQTGTVGLEQRNAASDLSNVAVRFFLDIPPTIQSQPADYALEGVEWSYSPTADGTPTPTFGVTGTLPAWLTWDATNERLYGTPGPGDIGTTASITLTASNGVTPDADQTFIIDVLPSHYAPGDWQVIAVRTASPAAFAFVSWVDIEADTRLLITNNGWTGTEFRDTQESIVWSSGGPLPAGTVVIIEDTGGGVPAANVGAAGGTMLNFASGSDQVFLLEGTFDGGYQALYGFNFGNQPWRTSGTATNATSYLPSTLSGANFDMSSISVHRNGQYIGPRTVMTHMANYIPFVNDMSRWATTDVGVIVLDPTHFSTQANVAPTITVSVDGEQITSGSLRIALLGSTLEDMAIRVEVDDANFDQVSLTTSVSRATQLGFDASEWGLSDVAVPAVIEPVIGAFSTNDVEHTITLTAVDANGAETTYTFRVRIGNPGGSSSGCGAAAGNSAGLWLVALALLGLVGLATRRRLAA